MILLLIFSTLCFILIWFIIYKVFLLYQNKKINKDIYNKLKKQNNLFIYDSKEVNIDKLFNVENKKELYEVGLTK